MPGADRVRVSGIAARAVAFACACALALTSSGVAAQTVEGAAALVGGRVSYDVKAGDTLKSIGARFGVDEAALIEMNQLANPNALAVGQRLTFDNTHIAVAHPEVNLTINVGQRLLVLTEGESVRAYPIAAGRRSWATPVGAFTITSREIDPVWEVPLSIQREMEQQGKTVITQFDASPAQVRVVRDRLQQVFLNLILNALDATEEGGELTITSAASDGVVQIEVIDNGCGIPAEMQQKLFEAYATTKETGTGLGLFVSRSLMQEARGQILLLESRPGRTVFRVSIPVA